METTNWPATRDLVLIGGGHAHALVLRKWGMNPLPGARVTLINPGPTAPYTGMLPGYIAGHYSREELDIDLVPLARFAGARLILSKAIGIDRAAKLIEIEGRPPIAYDVASIDIGITSNMPMIPGFEAHAIPAKPLGTLSKAWATYLANLPDTPKVAIIGGGVAGVELSLAMHFALTQAGGKPEITIIDRSEILTETSEDTRSRLRDALMHANIQIAEQTTVTEITAGALSLKTEQGESALSANFITGAAGAFPYAWLAETGLALEAGFIRTDPQLRSETDASIFAVGDCAHISHAPRPKAGVYAVRAAPILLHNLRATLAERPLKRFDPQSDFLKLVSLGKKSAVAAKWGRARAHPRLWQWKDRIDRAFMDKFQSYPAMPAPKLPALHAKGLKETSQTAQHLCGGCGAKVGPDTLSSTLARLGNVTPDDAATLPFGTQSQVLSHDHLRAFTSDPYMMARITAIHALGDVWAMGANPQAALTAITLPQMSPELQSRWLDEIMAAAEGVFSQAGAKIIGGHTSTGPELSIGFTVTGTHEGAAITKAGARAGDAIVLTKPIGTGVVLAGEMALKTRGDDYAATLEAMTTPQGDAARALAHATAMTDVTGFGLAGHLREICKASGVAAELDLAKIPTLPGAETLAAQGIRSTLFEQNRAAFPDAPSGPKADLLFDPQTAGGLLATVPADRIYGTVIGKISAGPPELKFT